MYEFIIEPSNGKKVKINSKKGKEIVYNYLLYGGHNGPCAINVSSGRCVKAKKADGYCLLKNGRCVKNPNKNPIDDLDALLNDSPPALPPPSPIPSPPSTPPPSPVLIVA